MSKKLIAIVRLAPGQVAWYDETTMTHLTIDKPIANVYDDMNFKKIKRAVANKILTLVSGSFKVETKNESYVEIPSAPVKPKIEVEVKKESKIEQKEVVEDSEVNVTDIKEDTEKTSEEKTAKTTKRRKKKEE